MKKKIERPVKDLKGEFEKGLIIDSVVNDSDTLIYEIEYIDKAGETKRVKREPYQIIYL